jgi:hypothetical protein
VNVCLSENEFRNFSFVKKNTLKYMKLNSLYFLFPDLKQVNCYAFYIDSCSRFKGHAEDINSQE